MKTTKTSRNLTQDCFEIFSSLNPDEIAQMKNLLAKNGKDSHYISIIKEFVLFQSEGKTIHELEQDEYIKNRLSYKTKNFNSLIKNFHSRLIELVAEISAYERIKAWHRELYKIIDESEALFQKGLMLQAEIHFAKCHQIIAENIGEANLYEVGYATSKYIYWNYYYQGCGQKPDLHTNKVLEEKFNLFKIINNIGSEFFLKRGALSTISDNKESYFAHIIYSFFDSINSYFRDKEELRYSIGSIDRQLQEFNKHITYTSPYIVNFPRFTDKPHEINLLISTFLKMQKFYLLLKAGDYFECETCIRDIYADIYTYSKDFNSAAMYGMILFLGNELFNTQVEIGLKRVVDNDLNNTNFDPVNPVHFFKPNEIENFHLRLELNRLINLFLLAVNKEDFKSIISMIRRLEVESDIKPFLKEMKMVELMVLVNLDSDYSLLESKIESLKYFLKTHNKDQKNTFEESFISAINELYERINNIEKIAEKHFTKLSIDRETFNPIQNAVLIWISRWKTFVYR